MQSRFCLCINCCSRLKWLIMLWICCQPVSPTIPILLLSPKFRYPSLYSWKISLQNALPTSLPKRSLNCKKLYVSIRSDSHALEYHPPISGESRISFLIRKKRIDQKFGRWPFAWNDSLPIYATNYSYKHQSSDLLLVLQLSNPR